METALNINMGIIFSIYVFRIWYIYKNQIFDEKERFNQALALGFNFDYENDKPKIKKSKEIVNYITIICYVFIAFFSVILLSDWFKS